MSVVIVFELSDSNLNEQIRDLLKLEGYLFRWISKNGEVINLPSNVVWKKGIEQKEARFDFKRIISKYNTDNQNVNLKTKSCLFLSAAPWSFVSDL